MEKLKEYIKFEKKDKWAILTLNNPPVNSLSTQITDQLNEQLTFIERDKEIHVVILTGSGHFFSAGGDLKEVEKINTQQEAIQFSNYIHSRLKRIETFSKPVIAAINGPCLGGGLELAMVCHIRIADEEAKFGLPEIKLSVIPAGGGTQRLPRIVGRAKAYEMILSGDTIDTKEGFRIGLVNLVAPKGKCLEYAESYAVKFSQKAPLAIASAIEAIRLSEEENQDMGLMKEASLFGRLCETDEMRQGIKIFLQGKKA